jgi:hypothetical protein
MGAQDKLFHRLLWDFSREVGAVLRGGPSQVDKDTAALFFDQICLVIYPRIQAEAFRGEVGGDGLYLIPLRATPWINCFWAIK